MEFYKCVSFECESGIKTLYFNDEGCGYDQQTEFFEENGTSGFNFALPDDLNGKIKLGYVASAQILLDKTDKLGLNSAPFAEQEFVADKNSKLSVAQQLSKALKNMPKVKLLEKSKAEKKSFVEYSDATDKDLTSAKAENYEIAFRNLLSIDKPIPTWCNRIMFYDRYFKTAKVQVDGKPIAINLSSKILNCGYNFIGEVVSVLAKSSRETDELVKIETRDGKFVKCNRWEIIYDHFIKDGEIKEDAKPFLF